MSAPTDFTYLYEHGHNDDLFVNLAANASNFSYILCAHDCFWNMMGQTMISYNTLLY